MSYIRTPRGKFFFKQRLLYPGCHIINGDIALENLKLLNEILSKERIFWEVAWGTLLGIVRDNDFIKWDEDTDIIILAEEEDLFKNLLWDLKKEGFELIRYERGGLYSISRKGEYIDFYVLRKASSEIRYSLDGGFFLEKMIKDIMKIDYKGLNIFVPRDYDKLLTFIYGDWRTPTNYYTEFGFIQRLKFLINYYCRLYLPNCIYYSILTSHRTSDLKRFVKKVEEQGIRLCETPEINMQGPRE